MHVTLTLYQFKHLLQDAVTRVLNILLFVYFLFSNQSKYENTLSQGLLGPHSVCDDKGRSAALVLSLVLCC